VLGDIEFSVYHRFFDVLLLSSALVSILSIWLNRERVHGETAARASAGSLELINKDLARALKPNFKRRLHQPKPLAN